MAGGLRQLGTLFGRSERLGHFIRLGLKRLAGIPELPGILAEWHRLIDDIAQRWIDGQTLLADLLQVVGLPESAAVAREKSLESLFRSLLAVEYGLIEQRRGSGHQCFSGAEIIGCFGEPCPRLSDQFRIKGHRAAFPPALLWQVATQQLVRAARSPTGATPPHRPLSQFPAGLDTPAGFATVPAARHRAQ